MSGCSPSADPVADYWDANREKVRDPACWMAHPLCRRAINRRISGSIHEWPLDWFRRVHGPTGFERGVSWGCGLGAFERAAVRIGLVGQIDAFDISPASLEDARRAAAEEGISGIEYRLGDFNAPDLPREKYDIVFFHQSLHHVLELERLFGEVRRGLTPGGAVYVDENVGPARNHWTEAELAPAQRVLDRVPPAAKLRTRLVPPVEQNDPSEAIRSDEIPDFLLRNFDLVEWKPYGGQIVDLVFPCVAREWTESAEGLEDVEKMIALEDEQLRASPAATHHLVAYGRLPARARGRVSGLLAGPRRVFDRLRRREPPGGGGEN